MDLAFVILVAVYLCLMGLIAIMDEKMGFFLEWKSKWKASPNAAKWAGLIPQIRLGFGVGGIILLFAGLAVNIYAWKFNGIVHRSSLIFWLQLVVTLFMSCFMCFDWLLRGGALNKSTHDSPAWAVAVGYAIMIYMLCLFIIDGGISAQGLSRKQAAGAQIQLESDTLDRSREQKRLMRDASAFWLWLGFIVAGDTFLPKKPKPESVLGKYSRTLEKL